MICTPSKKAKADTIWASTGCEKLKNDSIVQHTHSAIHRQSISATQLQKQSATAFARSLEKQTDSLVILCRNVYWLAMENVAIHF